MPKPDKTKQETDALLEAIARHHFTGAKADPASGFEVSLREAIKEAHDRGALGEAYESRAAREHSE